MEKNNLTPLDNLAMEIQELTFNNLNEEYGLDIKKELENNVFYTDEFRLLLANATYKSYFSPSHIADDTYNLFDKIDGFYLSDEFLEKYKKIHGTTKDPDGNWESYVNSGDFYLDDAIKLGHRDLILNTLRLSVEEKFMDYGFVTHEDFDKYKEFVDKSLNMEINENDAQEDKPKKKQKI